MSVDERAALFAGRDILITGGGGFIGSALSAYLARVPVRSLVVLDCSEQNLFTLQRKLSGQNLRLVLGSVTDRNLLEEVFDRFRPSFVLHAAAYKHVAVLEGHLRAAVLNNALATYWLACAARRWGVEKLVLVSTDKAVHPRSVMGASKRAAELLVTACGYSAVRLGNVWESTGSVVPLLREQLRQQQAMTVTDEAAARFFFTKDAAVQAILSTIPRGVTGRIFLPPFGEARRIVDVARSLSPDGEIRYSGLQPGEKLTEEFLYPDERIESEEARLSVVAGRLLSDECAQSYGERLAAAVERSDRAELLRILCELEPTYIPSDLARAEACEA